MKKYLKFIPLIIIAVVAISFVTSRGGKLQIGEPAKNNSFELVVTNVTKHYDSVDVEFTLKNVGKDRTTKMMKHGKMVTKKVGCMVAIESDGMIFMNDIISTGNGSYLYSDIKPLEKFNYTINIDVPNEALSGEKIFVEVKLPRKLGFSSVYKYEI